MKRGAYQPRIQGNDWGLYYNVSRKMNSQGDFFIHFTDTILGEKIHILPIKYSLETMIITALGIIAARSGRINAEYFLAGLTDQRDLLEGRTTKSSTNDIGYMGRSAEIWLKKKPEFNTDRYTQSFQTYQGEIELSHITGDVFFEISLSRYDGEHEIPLRLDMVPELANIISSPLSEVNEDYFQCARFVTQLIARSWN